MSRGPGKWQRAILAELANREAFYLRDLLGPRCTRAERNALLRAAIQLEGAGTINPHRFAYGGKTTVVYRIGTMFDGEDRRKLDIRWQSSTEEPCQHLDSWGLDGSKVRILT